jgi:hypothetical protein
MKKTIVISIISAVLMLTVPVIAEENLWEKDFVQALQKGKTKSAQESGGLGYTPAEASVLEAAMKKALDQKAPPCEAMKIAVDLEYKAYDVISNIFGHGGEVNLNQLCMCATESGINKQIVAKAATEATNSIGQPVFPRDEIAQAQCLNDVGLAYTPLAAPLKPIKPPKPPKPFSETAPNS